jgi:predicted protein tyrosine phosphatase
MTDWITVCSANAVKKVADEIKPSSIVSIVGRNCMGNSSRDWLRTSLSKRTPKLLPLNFDDIDNDGEIGLGRRAPLILPQRYHVQKLIKFSQETYGSMLLHCWAGISRSGAAAIIAAISRGHSVDESMWLIPKFSLSPNPRMIQFADEELGLNGELITAVKETEDNIYGSSIYKSGYEGR